MEVQFTDATVSNKLLVVTSTQQTAFSVVPLVLSQSVTQTNIHTELC